MQREQGEESLEVGFSCVLIEQAENSLGLGDVRECSCLVEDVQVVVVGPMARRLECGEITRKIRYRLV